MPGNIPVVNDMVQFRVKCVAGNQISLNVLHYTVTGVVGGGLTQAQLGSAFNTIMNPLYRALMSIDTFYNGVTVQNVTPLMALAVETPAHAAGTAIGAGAPRQASLLIRTHTLFAGRSNRGRIYIGFFSSTFMDTFGILNGAGFAALTTLSVALGPSLTLTFGGASTTLLLVVRHPNLPTPPGTPSGTPVTTVIPTALIATQKRRGDFGPTNIA